MKRMIVVVCLLCCSIVCCAQNWGEWFRQNNLQQKYLLAQLAALQSYARVAVKGYTITRDGLQAISAIRNGEFDLHATFFNSLASVRKVLQTYPGVARMLRILETILRTCDLQVTMQACYVQRVYAHLRKACQDNRDALQQVLADQAITMTDSERIRRMESIGDELCDLYAFFRDFNQRVCFKK